MIPQSKVCSGYAVAVAYMAYVEAAGFSATLVKLGRDKWRVVIPSHG